MANLRANKITGTEVFETTGSVQFDGVGGTGLTLNSSDFAFGTGDFCVEGWFNVTDSSSIRSIFDTRTSDNVSTGFFIGINSSDEFYTYGFPAGIGVSNWMIPTPGQWNHFAVTRQSNTGRVFINGVSVGVVDMGSTDYTQVGGTVGRPSTVFGSLYGFKGFISNLRVLKGTALYTKNFTPPTRELTVIPNTVLLACTSTTNTAQEATGKTITVNGNAVANELTPGLLTDRVKSGGTSAITGSVEFDGTGDYLSIPSSSDFAFGTGDFTVECWIYEQNRSPSSYTSLFQTDGSNSGGFGLVISPGSGGTLGIYVGGFIVTSTSSVPTNGWVHIAATRNSGTTRLFINGVLGGSSATSYTPTFNDIRIGLNSSSDAEKYNGFISNLRVLKGTALYTGSFIPPSRELKKIPNTVLLCCKNSSDPTAEETGKTITGYGDLEQDPPELVTDGGFTSAANWPSAGADWTISGGVATISSADSGFDFLGTLTSNTTNGLLYELRFDISSWTAGRLELAQSNSSNIGVTVTGNGSYTFRFRYTGTTNGNISLYSYTNTTSSFTLDNVSLKRVSVKRKGSNFTPQIGSDGSVTFDGVTKINTPNYFYLPTGNTENRGRGRGVFTISTGTPANSNAINYLQISSSGNSIDFGDLTSVSGSAGSVSSSTRMIIALANNSPVTASPGNVNTLDYLTIATTSNTLDFGDLTTKRAEIPGVSNSTRGVFIGGFSELVSPYSGPTINYTNTMDYISIASLGNALDFGDAHSAAVSHASAVGNTTRGVYTVSWNGSTTVNNINYITFSTTGNVQDFGDLITPQNRQQKGSVSNSTRGLFAGGISPVSVNTIEYITITSLGNAQDFGDLYYARRNAGGTSNSIRGVFAGGYDAPPGPLGRTNVIDYVILASTGNASDFGDLLENSLNNTGASDSHGGLS